MTQRRVDEKKQAWHASRLPLAVFLCACGIVAVTMFTLVGMRPRTLPHHTPFFNRSDAEGSARSFSVWWGDTPRVGTVASQQSPQVDSNIHPEDYAGADACRECHRKNYDSWSKHSHRWMNAAAKAVNVKGDFSGESISFQGGIATFYRDGGRFFMRLVREDERIYGVTQTIGSRFYQYYVGKQITGPATDLDVAFQEDHVLPFGYWLEKEEWVPIVRVTNEHADGQRVDPFAPLVESTVVTYTRSCNACHTTFALGDQFCREMYQMAREVPVSLHWSAANYLDEVRPELLPKSTGSYRDDEYLDLLYDLKSLEAPEHAINLGISCEACHLGSKDHVQHPKTMPTFFPASPHLRVEATDKVDGGRTHRNLNWTCGRCHSGERPQFAAGMATWNSTEYTDAMRGSCYSELKCVDCHDPHTTIGRSWQRTAEQDDAKCVRCHQQYATPAAQAAHSHHSAGSEGSRCMNCHMPRLNEGMQDVVRTHMIFSPTNRAMIYANQPNACNMCHTEKSIDWTLKYLAEWYERQFDSERIEAAYASRTQATAIGWLHSSEESVRLVAADTLFRTSSEWALDELINALDDPYLLNRQFARIGIENMKDVHLERDFGYRFYMMPQERRQPLTRLRDALLKVDRTQPNNTP